MRVPRLQLSYANVIATIALFVALGGAAVAAGLPEDSVGTRQLKPGAVTTADLHRNAVTSGKIRSLAVGSAKLADGSVTIAKLSSGVAGQLQGRPLESGQTLRGTFDLGDGTVVARQAISFQYPLTSLPDASEANVLTAGNGTAACPGLKGVNGQTPEAAPGQLCLYLRGGSGHVSFDPETVSRLGFGLLAKFQPPQSDFRAFGYWAVTAP